MQRPRVQARVAVGQRIDTRQDRDDPDRVQRCPPGPRVHALLPFRAGLAPFALPRLRIALNASSAASLPSGSVCR